jgi:colicin import membrane protein
MSSTRRLVLSFAVIAAMTGPACGGDPPDKEMQQAQSAIDAARAGGADQYARDEFTAAQDAFKRAQEAVAQHDYRLALNNALDAREQAQTAAKAVAERTDAERTLAGATASLNDARARLKAAEAARTSAKTLSASRRAIADGDAAVQKARTAFAQGAYLDAVSTATAATAGLKAAAHDLEAASPPAAHRRR